MLVSVGEACFTCIHTCTHNPPSPTVSSKIQAFLPPSRCVCVCVFVLAREKLNNALDHWKGIYRKARWLKFNAKVGHQCSTSHSISSSVYTHTYIFFPGLFDEVSGSATLMFHIPLSTALAAWTNISYSFIYVMINWFILFIPPHQRPDLSLGGFFILMLFNSWCGVLVEHVVLIKERWFCVGRLQSVISLTLIFLRYPLRFWPVVSCIHLIFFAYLFASYFVSQTFFNSKKV